MHRRGRRLIVYKLYYYKYTRDDDIIYSVPYYKLIRFNTSVAQFVFVGICTAPPTMGCVRVLRIDSFLIRISDVYSCCQCLILKFFGRSSSRRLVPIAYIRPAVCVTDPRREAASRAGSGWARALITV